MANLHQDHMSKRDITKLFAIKSPRIQLAQLQSNAELAEQFGLIVLDGEFMKIAMCRNCKTMFNFVTPRGAISNLNRHSEKCGTRMKVLSGQIKRTPWNKIPRKVDPRKKPTNKILKKHWSWGTCPSWGGWRGMLGPEQCTSSAWAVLEQFESSAAAVFEQCLSSARAVFEQCESCLWLLSEFFFEWL